MLSSDIALARRLEFTEAAIARLTAKAFAPTFPDTALEPIAGGSALFVSVGSPATHAMGIGMGGPVSSAEFDRLEQFFHSRGSACLIDLCPMADTTVTGAVMDRGYRIVEFNNVMARRILPWERFEPPPEGILATPATTEEGPLWAHTVIRGFMGDPLPPGALDMLAPMCAMGECYFGLRDGAPAGGGAMAVHDRVAALFGDSTLPPHRGRGVQQALIRTRLNRAAEAGCDLAMATVVPGTSSHRNYERCGFHLIYMRVNVEKAIRQKPVG